MVLRTESELRSFLGFADFLKVSHHSFEEGVWNVKDQFFVVREAVCSQHIDSFAVLVCLIELDRHSMHTHWGVPVTEGFKLGLQVRLIAVRTVNDLVFQSLGGLDR